MFYICHSNKSTHENLYSGSQEQGYLKYTCPAELLSDISQKTATRDPGLTLGKQTVKTRDHGKIKGKVNNLENRAYP